MSEARPNSPLNCSRQPPCPRLRVVAIVLAAGTASRMGGRPKCLLQWEGQTLLKRLLDALEVAGIDETVLVLGHNAEKIQNALQDRLRPVHAPKPNLDAPQPMRVHQVLNPQPSDGQNSSLHLALAKAQALNPQWLMVALADQPLLNAEDLKALIAAVKNSPEGTQMLQPMVNQQPGNPVMMADTVMSELQQAASQLTDKTSYPGGKAWRQKNPHKVHLWPTTNPHYKIDMDCPEDIEALQAQFGIQLVWG